MQLRFVAMNDDHDETFDKEDLITRTVNSSHYLSYITNDNDKQMIQLHDAKL